MYLNFLKHLVLGSSLLLNIHGTEDPGECFGTLCNYQWTETVSEWHGPTVDDFFIYEIPTNLDGTKCNFEVSNFVSNNKSEVTGFDWKANCFMNSLVVKVGVCSNSVSRRDYEYPSNSISEGTIQMTNRIYEIQLVVVY